MRVIESIAKSLGWTTTYWIGYQHSAHNGYVIGDMSMTVKPWITRQNMQLVREEVKRASGSEVVPSITFIRRIAK